MRTKEKGAESKLEGSLEERERKEPELESKRKGQKEDGMESRESEKNQNGA